MTRQQWLVFVPVTLATAGLTACASMLGGQQLQDLKVRPVETTQTQAASQRDPLYESAVAAINDRDYGRALDYLQAEKAKDPRNVKALNALGVVYDKLGRFDLSARYYAQAKAIEPDSKIVAENMGYSKVLQHIVDPAAPVAVATVDLPPNIATPSLPAAPAAPNGPMPAAKIANAAPAAPVAMTQSPVAMAKPSTAWAEASIAPAPKPEAKRVSAPPVAYAFAIQPSLASASSPSLPAMPVALAANAQPSSTPAVLAAPATSVVAQPELAAPVPPETVMPAAIPAGRLALAQAPHPAAAARSMSFPDSAPAPSSSHAVAIASAAQPVAPVVPIVRPPERKVAAPALYPIAPSRFKSEEISVLTMTQMESPVLERKPAAPAAIPAVPPLASPKAAAISNAPVVVRPPAPKADVASSVPAREKKPLVVASLAVPPMMHPAMEKSIRSASSAPAPAKPVAVSKPTVAPVATPARAAALQSAKPAPFTVKAATVKAPSLKTASAKPMVKAEPMKLATTKPAAPSPLAANRQVASKKFLTIGQPVRLTNASGKANGSGPVLRRLTVLGWTMRAAEGRAEPRTVLYYAKPTVAAAKALQRTLPFPVRLVVDKANASGMRLVIGRDYLSWKPKNTYMATLWQKGATTSPWQRASMKGAR